MLREDLKTVRNILIKKRAVSTNLQETADWCRPGLWYIEGPYARFKSVELPDVLRDSIRGVRSRKVSRELVERVAPPWLLNVGDTDSSTHATCTIAYLSSRGDWKLFDLDNQVIWTRLNRPGSDEHDREICAQFAGCFNIPKWNLVRLGGEVWRSEEYLANANVAHSSLETRQQILRILLRQFAGFAQLNCTPPRPEYGAMAVDKMLECAPTSIPSRYAQSHPDAMQRLANHLVFAPTHGDLSGQNVFVRDGEPWIIDWDTAGDYQPLFHDPLYMILREAELGRPDLLQAYLRGSFDNELARLFTVCGLSAPPCDNLSLLMHSYIVRFHDRRTAGNRDACRANVETLWNRLVSYCAIPL